MKNPEQLRSKDSKWRWIFHKWWRVEKTALVFDERTNKWRDVVFAVPVGSKDKPLDFPRAIWESFPAK
jgi:hypothetical protein